MSHFRRVHEPTCRTAICVTSVLLYHSTVGPPTTRQGAAFLVLSRASPKRLASAVGFIGRFELCSSFYAELR
ncbi:unnamed protein product [Lampetra planeri]